MATIQVISLRAFFLVLCCVVAATIAYTIATDGLPLPNREDVYTPWFKTTVLDFYTNVAVLAAWILYKESSWISAIIWVILLVVVGSSVICLYVFLQLLKLTPQEFVDPIYNILLRDSNKNGVEDKTKSCTVITVRIIFGALGCLMTGTLLYTIFTDGTPFRKELLTPWMVALLTDFYVNVAVLSVWLFYKESSWIGAILWMILFVCLGSVSTCVYVVLQLSHLSSQDPVYLVLLNNYGRTENGYQRISQ